MTENQTQASQDQPPSPASAPAKRRWLRRLLVWGGTLTLAGIAVAAGLVVWGLIYFGRDLPDYRQLAKYEPAVVTRIHAGDGNVLAEYARQPRLFVPYSVIPEKLVQAFLAAEDKKFFEHAGLDYPAILRAGIQTSINMVRGGPLRGASTITQQVARNFLLTLDQRVDRKIKEMILTLRIERAFTKEQILELYLNEINFGNQSYGVAAAALNYFNRSLDELSIAEIAYLAALPKGPHNYHPVRHKARALERRNWVLSRMHLLGFITKDEYQQALAEDLVSRSRETTAAFRAEYFSEEVRRQLLRRYGVKTLYEGGLSVRTTLEPKLQSAAERALRAGLVAYDRRHGWRGELARLPVTANWESDLAALDKPLGQDGWQIALVHEVRAGGAIIGLVDGRYGYIDLDDARWAREWRAGERLGPRVAEMGAVLQLGDVIAVAEKGDTAATINDFWTDEGAVLGSIPRFTLQQVPEVGGAIVALDPHTGRVLALVGGFDYALSEYNRATQALRQPGSAFKPFVYAAALEEGFTPASLVLDAPFVIDQGQGQGKWKPKNSSNRYYGPSTLRLGLERSRNLMTIRLAQHLGMDKIVTVARRFGVADNMERTLAASLGAGEVTLLQLTAAYGALVNGGHRIQPTLIDRIQDRRGKTIFRHDERACTACDLPLTLGLVEPSLPDTRRRVLDPKVAFQMVSMLEGVVQNGSGRKIRAVGKPLAGKTGTTNEAADAWFVGFHPDLAVGVFVGFDQPRSLGPGEEGSSVAVPIFRDFMADVLAGEPALPFRAAEGIRLVRINRDTGLLASSGDERVIVEAFIPGTEPGYEQLAVLDGSLPAGDQSVVKGGTGGIY